MFEDRKALMPFMLIVCIIGEIAIYGSAYFAPLNNINIPAVSCTAGVVSALWVLVINQRWVEPHGRTRYMWENHIRVRALVAILAAGFAAVAMSVEFDEAPYCLTAIAGTAAVQTIIIFAVLCVGIVLQEMEKGRRKA